MKDPREVIIRPIVTEHSYDQMENNVYTFEVAKDSNKVEIRQAIEEGRFKEYKKKTLEGLQGGKS